MGRIKCGGGEDDEPVLRPLGWKSYASRLTSEDASSWQRSVFDEGVPDLAGIDTLRLSTEAKSPEEQARAASCYSARTFSKPYYVCASTEGPAGARGPT
jgi:hypothetical protein